VSLERAESGTPAELEAISGRAISGRIEQRDRKLIEKIAQQNVA